MTLLDAANAIADHEKGGWIVRVTDGEFEPWIWVYKGRFYDHHGFLWSPWFGDVESEDWELGKKARPKWLKKPKRNPQALISYDGLDEAQLRKGLTTLVTTAMRVVDWLESLAEDSDVMARDTRFSTLSDAAKFDAKNYRATANTIKRVIPAPTPLQEESRP